MRRETGRDIFKEGSEVSNWYPTKVANIFLFYILDVTGNIRRKRKSRKVESNMDEQMGVSSQLIEKRNIY